mgnify:FL=1
MYGEITFKDESHQNHTKGQAKDNPAFKCEIGNNISQPAAIQTDLNKRVNYTFMEKDDE